MEQLSNLGMTEQERLNRNPLFQAAHKPSLKQRFLGGLASGLDRFAENKMQQMERQKEVELYHRAGFRPEVADTLVHLRKVDPGHFSDILKNLGTGAYEQSSRSESFESNPRYSWESENQAIAPKETLAEEVSPKRGRELASPRNISSVESSRKMVNTPIGVTTPKSLFGKEDQLLQKELLSRQKEERKFQHEEEKEQRKLEHEEQKNLEKDSKAEILKIKKDADGAREAKLRLNRMKKLIDTGKLSNPLFASAIGTLKEGVKGIFGHVGVDLSGLLTPETQEFGKLSTDFAKNAKDFFPSRVTDRDLQTFLETVPQLSQTNEGKAAVIHQLETMADMAELRNEGMRHVLKKHNNKVTPDFLEEIEEYIKPKMDKLADKFIKGINKAEKVVGTRSLPREIIEAPLSAILGVS